MLRVGDPLMLEIEQDSTRPRCELIRRVTSKAMRVALTTWFALASVILTCSSEAHAQSGKIDPTRGAVSGSIFGGGIWVGEAVAHLGGALEVAILRRVSLVGEAGVATDNEEFGLAVASARVSYAFVAPANAESEWVPFLTAGVSSGLNAVSVGFGAAYWGRDRFGLRLEAITYGRPGDGWIVELRTGIAFRRSARPRS